MVGDGVWLLDGVALGVTVGDGEDVGETHHWAEAGLATRRRRRGRKGALCARRDGQGWQREGMVIAGVGGGEGGGMAGLTASRSVEPCR